MSDLLKELLKLVTPNKKTTNQWWHWTKLIIKYIAHSSALALEMIWRQSFGRQYLAPLGIGASITAFLYLAVLLSFARDGYGQINSTDRNMAVLFCIATFINASRHLANINNATQTGIQRHGMDSGISIFPQFLKISDFRAKLVIEPIANIALSFLLALLGASLLSTFIFFGTALAWWREFQLQNKLRRTYNNIINSRIDAQRMKQMAKGGIQGYYQNNQQGSTRTGKVKKPNPLPHDSRRSK